MSYSSDSVTPPVQGRNVYPLTVTTSSAFVEVPAAWMGHYITIEARGGNVHHAFKYGSTMTVDETAVSTVGSNVISAMPANGARTLPDGTTRDYDLRMVKRIPASDQPTAKLLFGFKGSANCVLIVTVSDGYVAATAGA